MTTAPHQVLPRSGPEREKLRKKGQFWTPDWVADAMVAYVLRDRPDEVFDPAVGEGAFFHAVKRVSKELKIQVELRGSEIDPSTLEAGKKNGLSESDLLGVESRDFVADPPARGYSAIVANPPYVRHHYIPRDTKAFLQRSFSKVLGAKLDGPRGSARLLLGSVPQIAEARRQALLHRVGRRLRRRFCGRSLELDRQELRRLTR